MISPRRNLTIAAGAAVTAGITWALASGVVVLYPATLNVTLALPSEAVTSITARAYPLTGSYTEKSISPPAGASGPYAVDLTINGGDPADANDSGVAYRPALYAYLSNPSASQTYLYIQKNTAITIDNTPTSPSASATAAFSYPTTYRANAAVSVVGGTLSGLQIYAYANDTQLNEYYSSYSYKSSGTPYPSTISNWAPMTPNNSVTVYGTAYLVASDGSTSQRSLTSQTVNLSQGSANVNWTIDLTNTGNLEGSINLAAAPTSTAVPTSYYVLYEGASSTTYGIHGNSQVSPSLPSYSVTLTPGDYDVYLRTYLSSPSQYFDTKRESVTIVAATTLVKDFTNGLSVGRLGLTVGGFFTKENLSSSGSYLRGPQYENYAYDYQLTNGLFEHTLPAGTWQPYYTHVSLNDQSNPSLPLNSQIYKYPYTDAATPPTAISAGSDVSLGTSTFTLVRSNVYFDVIEAAGAPALNIVSPSVQANKYEYNADSSLRSQSQVFAYGSSTAQPLSGLTMVAEPGEYMLDAHAYVNGTYTKFAGTSITFGEPIDTPAGTAVGVTLTPVQNPDLKVDLTFPDVTTAGLSTVVETPLGPAPPEGLRTFCADNPDVTCAPIYYDISTTATFQSPVTVCVRRLVMGVPNAATGFLHLYHYNESLPTTDKWEELPPPPDRPAAIDCGSGDPADLEACGCVDEASCGIDLFADPQLDVFQVCGVTTSFSPFAIFQGPLKVSNVVNGLEFTGPTGPPSLQQWTVPGNGTYRITATGAKGGSATTAPTLSGGCGAEIAGDFTLQVGDVIQFLVGQKGTAAANNAGGGGGTFVLKNGAPLVIAGGGGGVRSTATVNGRNGTVAATGTAGSTSTNYTAGFIPGGANGAGGSRVAGYGTGGGGWSGNGAADGTYGEGGFSFLGANRGKGGSGLGCGVPAHGGYGGGGAGNGCYGAGGGGGYSGGGGGRVAGGGGSLNNGLNPTGHEISPPCATSNGLVTIDLLP